MAVPLRLTHAYQQCVIDAGTNNISTIIRHSSQDTLWWVSMSDNKKILMTPGPTELPWRVIRAMMRPSIAHYDPDFNIGVLDATLLELRKIFKTSNEVLAVPGSGRVALETAIASAIEPGDNVLSIVAGAFGPWQAEMVRRVGGKATEYEVEWGKGIDLDKLEETIRNANYKAITIAHNETTTGAVYPIDRIGELARKYDLLYFVDTVSSLGGMNVETDKWGIDFNMTASHKCLGAPIGLAIVSVSEKGWKKMEMRKKPATTFSYDLLRWKKWWLPKERGGTLEQVWRRQPITMPIYSVYALAEATKMIMEEGLENVLNRHHLVGEAVRAGLEAIGLQLFSDENIRSDTLTAFNVPSGVKDSDVRGILSDKYGIMISGGLQKMSGKLMRIGHMGETAQPRYIRPTIIALEAAMADVGHKFERGAGVRAAGEILKRIEAKEDVSPL
jgi:aspartate aminotransferase-like enzyme